MPKTPAKPKAKAVQAGRTSKTAPPKARTATGRPKAGQQVDWEAVERDYRTGRFTDIELSNKHKVSPTTIERTRRRDRDNGRPWTKDLRDIIRQETSAAVLAQATEKARENVAETIQIAVELNKQVILGHRRDIKDIRDHAFALLRELGFVPDNSGIMLDALETMRRLEEEPRAKETPEEREARLRKARAQFDILRKLIADYSDIHIRVGSAQKLADTITKLQALERKAFDLDKEAGGAGAFEDFLGKVMP